MFNPGNQATEDTSVPVYGSCLEYSDGQWGTVYGGVAVWGASWRDRFLEYDYVINWRAIIDHNLPTPTGVGIAHLTDLPAWGGECSIIFDVTYERCPEHRADCGQHPKPW